MTPNPELLAQWEARLSAEGLGERSLFMPHGWEAVAFVSTETCGDRFGSGAEEQSFEIYGRQMAWHELSEAEVWQTLEHQAQTLPVLEAREFLASYCQDGNLLAAARRHQMTRSRALWLLALANRHWRLMQARLAPGDVYGQARERERAAG